MRLPDLSRRGSLAALRLKLGSSQRAGEAWALPLVGLLGFGLRGCSAVLRLSLGGRVVRRRGIGFPSRLAVCFVQVAWQADAFIATQKLNNPCCSLRSVFLQ